MKYCKKCDNFKNFNLFVKDKNSKDGLYTYCKNCHSKRQKIRDKTENGKKYNKEYRQKYYKKNELKIKTYKKGWHFKHKERLKIEKHIYYKNNLNAFYARASQRRAIKLKAKPKWLTLKQLLEMNDIYKQAKELEKIFFNRKFHVDHIVPLQGKDVCGLHVPWNLQILTAEENTAKKNYYQNMLIEEPNVG